MAMKHLLFSVTLCLLAGPANAAQSLFAIAPWDAEGNPFQSALDSGAFVTSESTSDIDALLKAWSSAGPVRGMDASGRIFPVTVTEVNEPSGMLGDSPLHFRFDADPIPGHPVLVWTGETGIEFVRASPTSLNTAALSSLQQNAKSLVSRSVARRGERMTWALGTARTLRIAGTAWVVATTPITLEHEGHKDDRGWVFQVFNALSRQIAWQQFGHPEWTSEPTGVLEVTAALFFRVKGSDQILMLGEHGSGWESSEWAIYDLVSGKALSVSY